MRENIPKKEKDSKLSGWEIEETEIYEKDENYLYNWTGERERG